MQRRMFFMGLVATLATTLNATISRALVWSLVTQEEFDREVAEFKSRRAFGVEQTTSARTARRSRCTQDRNQATRSKATY